MANTVTVLSALLLAAACAHGDAEFDQVNRLRVQAGLAPLSADGRLAHAAALHAAYLDLHREPGERAQGGLSAHAEEAGREGFSGANPGDRAVAAGYPYRGVRENVSMGYPDAGSAVDGLMSAIYHRLTFLDLLADEMGLAVGRRSRVFLLGRRDLGSLCDTPPDSALASASVDCLGTPMHRAHYEALCADLPDAALFRPSYPVACPGGRRLDDAFMRSVCADPPDAARFSGHGRHYVPCDDGTAVDADWFDAVCAGALPAALYRGSGHYYAICGGQAQVSAEWLEATCASLPADAVYRDSGRYRRPCAGTHDIRIETLDALDAERLAAAPDWVLWPPRGGDPVPPAFFVEEPDPLPDLDVAGYPVSLQFNPARFAEVALRRFALARVDGDRYEPVEELRLLDHGSDPHRLLGRHEFVVFPLQRLDWAATYQVEVEVLLDGRVQTIEWAFDTAGGELPLLTARGETDRFVVDSGTEYLLYLPPRPGEGKTISSGRSSFRRGNRLTVEPVDPNTVRIRLEARWCDPAELRFGNGRGVELVPSGCAGPTPPAG